MLHHTLSQLIKYAEFRLCYDSKMRITHPVLNKELKEQIRTIRSNIRTKTGAEDALAIKSKTFNLPGSWAATKSDEFDKVVYANKTAPAGSLGQWRSIEFEVIFKSVALSSGFAKWVRAKKYQSIITVKNDGSIKPNKKDEMGREIIVTYKTGEEQIVKDVCAYLRDKAYVNATCGTHVHFDMRHTTYSAVETFGQRIGRCVPALKTIFPKARRNNEYCGKYDVSSDNRYSFVNLTSYSKYKTLEIRGHSGTIIANKILNWIKICEIIMTNASSETFDDIQKVITFFKFDDELSAYVNKRYNEFNKGAARDSIEDIDSDHVPLATQVPIEAPPIITTLTVS